MTAEISFSPSRAGDRWIPYYFVLFFLVVCVVDGIFVYLAVSTQTGTVSNRSYESGLEFNTILAKAQAQRQLGMTDHATYINGELVWTLNNRNGTPLSGANVHARLIRTVQGGQDFEIGLPMIKPGVYGARIRPPAKGQWRIRLKAQWNTHSYQKIIPVIVE
jgi:nitrogen fixation protein FixH